MSGSIKKSALLRQYSTIFLCLISSTLIKISALVAKLVCNFLLSRLTPIIKSNKNITSHEECLSIPGESGDVIRKQYITVVYKSSNNNISVIHCNNFLSICIQHEIDHLNGLLWIDYQSSIKKTFIKNKMLKLIKNH